ncbi:nuclear transport factor 2 family protein [Hymenobacter jejuensis]|uniref:Nuclear transport factor 2 family protein n=1 Tax=Hymenobacter jejuensis TaxID=2502781 RepID=A0A5B8A468_9BACT|nr:nuclear transport factor 2 family protein [Hymenobacter jejuensis]QDA60922.1 nuclear transport factor 2 family protein [Hymenobacter jejuensis]
MNEQQNTQTVQEGYALFGKGDIPNLLNLYTDDVEFIIPGSAETVPFAGVYRGKEQVATFFAKLHDAIDYERFEPQNYIAQGDRLVVLGFSKGKVRATGRTDEEEWAHSFIMQDGKVARFQAYLDTEASMKAFRSNRDMAEF